MAPGDFAKTFGKQRVVWAQPGGTVLVGNQFEHIEAVVIETGTAAREDFFMMDGTYVHNKVSIPIMTVPAGATVLKAVAIAAPATIHWDEDADPSAIWGVDQVEVEENTTTRQLSIIAEVVEGGEKTDMPRIAYHITIFIQGRKYVADPQQLLELETA
jgi:hypothetical protein